MNKTREDRKAALIKLLLDQDALDADRDDAAMDLGDEFDDEPVLNALIQVGKNPSEIDMILSSCGESIGEIWVKRSFFDEKVYRILAGTARYGVYIIVASRKPEWIERYHLEEDKFYE